MAEATTAACGGREIRHHFQLDLHYRHHHQLRDALTRLDGERLAPPVPTRHHQVPLAIGVDQSHEISQHHTVLVPEPGSWQDHGSEPRVLQVDGEPCRNQLGLAGFQQQVFIDAGAQVHARRAAGGVCGQGKIATNASIQDAHLQRAELRSLGLRHASAEPRWANPLLPAAYDSAMSATNCRASVTFGALPSSRRALRHNTSNALSSQSNALSWPTSLAAIMSRFFFISLPRACCSTDSVSAAKPTTNGLSGRADTVASTSIVRSMLRSIRSEVFLIFCSAAVAGR